MSDLLTLTYGDYLALVDGTSHLLIDAPPLPITATLDVVDLSDLATPVATVDGLIRFDWKHRRHILAPAFQLDVAYDAAVLPDLTDDRVVRLSLNGTVVYSGIVEQIVTREVEQGEASDQNPTVIGRPLAAVLDRIVVRPQFPTGTKPWSKTRSFHFGSPEFDVSGWSTATELVATWDAPSAHWERGPAGFPDFGAGWIGPDDGTDITAPLGDCYFVYDYTLADAIALAFFNGSDNSGTFFHQGMSLLNIEQYDVTQFTNTHNATANGTAGTNRYAAKVSNFTGLDDTQNPTGLIACCFETDGSGRLGDLVFHTDATFKILKRPASAPGFTIGEIIRIIVDENQSDGLAPWLTLGFDDVNDSNGNPWDAIEMVTVNVKDTLLKLLQDWSQLYCHWSFTDAGVLNAYRIGEQGVASGVIYEMDVDPDLGALQMLERDQVFIGTDCLMVEWADGYVRVPTSGGNRMGGLTTNAQTEPEAIWTGTLALAQQGDPEQIATVIAPTGVDDVPGVDWVLADTIELIPPSGSVVESVEEWGGTVTDYVEFDVTVSAYHLAVEERTALWLQRMTGGAGGGTAPSAPGGPAPRFTSQAALGSQTFSAPDPLVTGEAAKDDNRTAAGNLYALELRLKTTGSTDTTVEIWVNGSSVGSCTIPAGEYNAVEQVTAGTLWVLPTDVLTVNITAVGTDAAGLTAKPWFV